MTEPSSERRVRVRLTLEPDGRARIKADYVGGVEAFKGFRRAIEGARYDHERKTNLADVERVPHILRRLREPLKTEHEGVVVFDVKPSPELKAALYRADAQRWLDYRSAEARIEKVDEEIRRRTGRRMFPFQKTGALELAVRKSYLLADDMGLGKAVKNGENVLTPTGWVPVEEIKVGDSVIGSDGRAKLVDGVYPQGLRTVYRVTLNDGCALDCDLDHLWAVQTPLDRYRGLARLRVMTVRQLLAAGVRAWVPSRGTFQSRWFVPVVKPVEFETDDILLPIAPYLLGALIANGHFAKATIAHSGTDEQRRAIRPYVTSLGLKLVQRDDCTFALSRTSGVRNSLVTTARTLGLMGSRSWNKTIPRPYLHASVAARKALLQGLFDNDGTISADGATIEYNTTSSQLAADVQELVRSLGGIAWMSTRIPTYTYKGKKLRGRTDHRVRVALDFNPFSVASKAERFAPRSKYPPAHAIESIRRIGRARCTCIHVRSDDHLFVTRDYVLTHNTLQTIAAVPAGAPLLVIGTVAAKAAWVAEMELCRPQTPFRMLSGRGSFAWPRPGEGYVTNYDVLPSVHAEGCDGKLPAKPCEGCREVVAFVGNSCVTRKEGHEPDCTGLDLTKEREECPGCALLLRECPAGIVVVFDEAHWIKNSHSLRGLRCRAIARAAMERGGRVWLVTGTPMQNEPKELWSLLSVADLAREAFGSWDTFVDCFDGKPKMFGGKRAGYAWGQPKADVPARLQRVMLRRSKAEVLPQLPAKMWRELPVTIDKRTIAQCDAYLRREGGVESIAERMEKQLLAGDEVKFDGMSAAREALAKAKIPALVALVEELEAVNEPVIVFSWHRKPIDELAKRRGWAVITGDVTAEKRKPIVERFQAGKLRGLALTIGAGAESITLTRANQVVFVDLAFKPSANEQAEDRACRLGQIRGVVVTILKADHPLDRRVVDILTRKRKIIAESVEAASKDDDAPARKREIEDRLRVMQEEIAAGGVLRRIHKDAEEERVLETLHTGAFRPEDERLARDLAEQGSEIGLSEKQWALAADVAKRAARGGAQLPATSVPLSEREESNLVREAGSEEREADSVYPADHVDGMATDGDGLVVVAGVPHEHGCAACDRTGRACDCGSLGQEEREAMAEVDEIMKRIRGLTDDQRVALADLVSEEYCRACGKRDTTDDGSGHECPVADEDEEDDEDDDE